jgi:hypothetical protein
LIWVAEVAVAVSEAGAVGGAWLVVALAVPE